MRHRFASILAAMILITTSGCYPLVSLFFSNPSISYASALGDIDGDGDLDAVLANGANEMMYPDTVWINQGGRQANSPGSFINSGTRLANQRTNSVSLGDLDSDGDLDVLAANDGSLKIYVNQGGVQGGRQGNLAAHGQWIWQEQILGQCKAALGDLDGDGDLDAYIANCCGSIITSDRDSTFMPPADLVYLNDGSGVYTDSGQRLGQQGTSAAALSDLDGDGDLDVYAANSTALIDAEGNGERNQPDRVWFNDGSGHFSDSGQRLGSSESSAVALGDLDGDGDIDALTASRDAASIWLNDGVGNFTDSGQRLSGLDARSAHLGDFDGDNDLDALITSWDDSNLWLNDGTGAFRLSGQRLEIPRYYSAALGDLDSDGDLDVFAGYLDKHYQVWWNDGFGRLGNRWR